MLREPKFSLNILKFILQFSALHAINSSKFVAWRSQAKIPKSIYQIALTYRASFAGLFVNLTLLNDMGPFIQKSPVFGESWWVKICCWWFAGSLFPLVSHSVPWNLYRWSSTCLTDRDTVYFTDSSSPLICSLMIGNILLWIEVSLLKSLFEIGAKIVVSHLIETSYF